MKKVPIVFFNASVIIAGLISPKGGSAKLFDLAKKKKVFPVISEVVFNEVLKHQAEIPLTQQRIIESVEKNFHILHKPSALLFNQYKSIILDKGDLHVLASAKEINADFLVTLDKKHLLSLKNRVKDFKIVTPGELITFLK